MHARTAVVVMFFIAAWGCAAPKPLREIPEEALGAIATEVDAYESEKTAAKLAKHTAEFDKLAKSFRGFLDKKSHPFVTHDPALDVPRPPSPAAPRVRVPP